MKMKKAMLWIVVVALVCSAGCSIPAGGQTTEIAILVGPNIIDDPNKEMMPIPEFTYGIPFVVEVIWVEPDDGSSLKDLSLTLSEFRLVTFNPCSEGEPIWSPDRRQTLTLFEVQDEKSRPVDEMVFSFLDAGNTRRTMILNRVGPTRDVPQPQLIMFKQTVRRNGEVLFVHDPPWVGRGRG